MQVQIDDDMIQALVKRKAEEMLQPYQREAMAVSAKEMTQLTGLSLTFLRNHVLFEPEMQDITMKLENRIIYMYPEVRDAFRTIVQRKNLLKHGRAPQWEEASC